MVNCKRQRAVIRDKTSGQFLLDITRDTAKELNEAIKVFLDKLNNSAYRVPQRVLKSWHNEDLRSAYRTFLWIGPIDQVPFDSKLNYGQDLTIWDDLVEQNRTTTQEVLSEALDETERNRPVTPALSDCSEQHNYQGQISDFLDYQPVDNSFIQRFIDSLPIDVNQLTSAPATPPESVCDLVEQSNSAFYVLPLESNLSKLIPENQTKISTVQQVDILDQLMNEISKLPLLSQHNFKFTRVQGEDKLIIEFCG